MKKKLFYSIVCLLSASLFVSCGTNNDSSIISEEKSDNQREKVDAFYHLENGENYTKMNTTFGVLSDLSSINKTTIENQSFYVNPFSISYFLGEVTVRYPNEQTLANQNILYTSAWYNQNTFKRNDDCIEYIIERNQNGFGIADIKNNSNNFIPFNGAVLSVNKDNELDLEIGDEVIINYNIPKYQIGFYNQNGNRVVVDYANSYQWNSDGIFMYDDNYLSYVTDSRYSSVAMVNILYDNNNKEYFVDRFRYNTNQGKLYTNVNNGFCLASTLVAKNNNLALLEGVRFNIDDTIKVEQAPLLYEKKWNLNLSGENTVTLLDSKVITFTLTKTNNPYYTSNPWRMEVSVDKNGVILEYGYHVDIASDGYKFIVAPTKDTNSEKLSLLCGEMFARGNVIDIKNSDITISNNLFDKYFNLYNITSNYLENSLNNLEQYNYSYDYETIFEVEKEISDLSRKMDILSDSDDDNDLFRLYNLTGKLAQDYSRLYSATTRNEASMIKSCWYILNYAKEDYNLETLRYNLDIIKNSGLNEIIVYVFDNGSVYYNNSKIYSLNSSATNKDYGIYGNDVLKALIGEAHARNMTIQACFCPFTSKIEKANSELRDQFALSVKGNNSVITSQGAVSMLDPASPLVQQKIIETIDDIIESNPGLDGIHLDYIRYGADNDAYDTVMGVTENARVGFNEYCQNNHYSYNFTSLDSLRTGLSNANTLAVFNSYQQELITDTVKNIKNECLKYDLPLTCAIAENYERTRSWKCQDWATWAKKGYVDVLYLMDYYFDEHWINYYYKDMLNATGNSTMFVTGISTSYAALFDDYYNKTVKGALLDYNCAGYGMFGTHTNNAKKDAWELIKSSNYLDNISCYDTLKNSMYACKDLLISRCDNIYIRYNNQTTQQKEMLLHDLENLCNNIENDNYDNALIAISKLEEMLEKNYASNEANNRISEQLSYMLKIAKMKENIFKQ